MANTSSAKKAYRQSLKRRVRNVAKTSRMRRLSKELAGFAAVKDQKKASEMLSLAYQAIDKAVKTGVLKKNTAARKKSRLARLVRMHS